MIRIADGRALYNLHRAETLSLSAMCHAGISHLVEVASQGIVWVTHFQIQAMLARLRLADEASSPHIHISQSAPGLSSEETRRP